MPKFAKGSEKFLIDAKRWKICQKLPKDGKICRQLWKFPKRCKKMAVSCENFQKVAETFDIGCNLPLNDTFDISRPSTLRFI